MVTLFIGLLFVLAIVVFAFQNVVPIDIRFMGWSFHTLVSNITLLAAAAGAIFTLILVLGRSVRGSLRVWEAQGRVRRLQGELKAAQEAKQRLQQELNQYKKPTPAVDRANGAAGAKGETASR